MAGLKLSCCLPPSRHCFTSLHKTLTTTLPCLGSRLLLPPSSLPNPASARCSRLPYSCNYSYSCPTPSAIPVSATTLKKKRIFSFSAIDNYPLSGISLLIMFDWMTFWLVTSWGRREQLKSLICRVWSRVVKPGDTVIDATCGNGHDTLAMLKLVADESGRGRVYGLDIQKDALNSSSSLLDESLTPKERELVKLFGICHSRMEGILPENSPVRLVAFNLGYLPGGDKDVITVPETTRLALDAAKRILLSGGLISLVVYIGHPGGREELEAVEGFASGLSVDEWSCCKFQLLNRPVAPVLVFLFKRDNI
ncbi:Putative rRNA methylase YtqB [Linum perenne]